MEVTHNQLKKLIRTYYEDKEPLDIKGGPGIGKSEVVKGTLKNIAEEKGLKFVYWNEIQEEEKEAFLDKDLSQYFIFSDMRLSQMEPTDLKGFPNNQREFARWVPTLLFKLFSNPEAHGCVFFDEANLATPSTMAACYQIIHDKQIGETPISKNIFFISAGNRIDETNNAFEEPAPLNNRRGNIILLPPKVHGEENDNGDNWLNWASEKGIDTRVVSFLMSFPSKIYTFDPDSNDPSFGSPRTWAKVGLMIKDIKNPDEVRLLAAPLIGEALAIELRTHIKKSEKIDVKKILNNPKEIEKYKDEMDKKYSIIAEIVEMYKNQKKNERTLDKSLALGQHIEPEFAIFMVKMMKGCLNNKEQFPKELMKCDNWKKVTKEFAKYLVV